MAGAENEIETVDAWDRRRQETEETIAKARDMTGVGRRPSIIVQTQEVRDLLGSLDFYSSFADLPGDDLGEIKFVPHLQGRGLRVGVSTVSFYPATLNHKTPKWKRSFKLIAKSVAALSDDQRSRLAVEADRDLNGNVKNKSIKIQEERIFREMSTKGDDVGTSGTSDVDVAMDEVPSPQPPRSLDRVKIFDPSYLERRNLSLGVAIVTFYPATKNEPAEAKARFKLTPEFVAALPLDEQARLGVTAKRLMDGRPASRPASGPIRIKEELAAIPTLTREDEELYARCRPTDGHGNEYKPQRPANRCFCVDCMLYVGMCMTDEYGNVFYL